MKQPALLLPQSKVAIAYRTNTPRAIKLGLELVTWLKKNDLIPYTVPHQKPLKGTKGMSRNSQFDSVNMVIVLGGDGTYLRAAQLVEGRPIPILGVNLGSLGFLTIVRAEALFETLEQVMSGHMSISPRSMVTVKLKRKGKTKKIMKEWISLNDIVIERGPSSHLINLSIYSEKHFVSDLKADGLIIATPTGSTAYNLAAGGPIMHPEVRALVATPIAPHALTNRPLLFPDQRNLLLKIKDADHRAKIIIDGQYVDELKLGDELTIKRSSEEHYFVCTPDLNYFEILREKLKFGERA